jgi:hypothetical protein
VVSNDTVKGRVWEGKGKDSKSERQKGGSAYALLKEKEHGKE